MADTDPGRAGAPAHLRALAPRARRPTGGLWHSVRVRRADRREEVRVRLLAAARQVFGDLGWGRARVEDICQLAGVGHGTYYSYFASKAEALESLVRSHALDLEAVAADPAAGPLPVSVRTTIDNFARLSAEGRAVRSALAQALPTHPELAACVDDVREAFVARARATLERAQAVGSVRLGLDVDAAARALTAMVEHSVELHLAGRGRDGLPHLVDVLTDLWVHAVAEPATLGEPSG